MVISFAKKIPVEVRLSHVGSGYSDVRWEYQGSTTIGAYFMELTVDSSHWGRVTRLFSELLDGSDFEIRSITAVVCALIVVLLTK